MQEVLRIAVGVSTPLGFLGLIVALGFLAYALRIKYQENKLQALPPDQRALVADEYLTRYGIKGNDLPPAAKLALIRDELEKRHHGYFRYFIAATVAFVVCFVIAIIGPIEDPDAFLYSNGTISEPSDREVVNARFNASGTANDVRKGVYLWLAIEINGKIWPREGHLIVRTDGQWNQPVFEDGRPDQFALSLWATNTAANLQVQAWLDRGLLTGNFPEFPPVPGMKRLDRKQGLRVAAQR
jgi:hypothetical protein